MGNYTLLLEPISGPTLAKTTYQEFMSGITFRILRTTASKYRKYDHLTKVDIERDEEYHHIKYDIQFNILTVEQYIASQDYN